MSRNAVAYEAAEPPPDVFCYETVRGHPGAYRFIKEDGVAVAIVHACPCGCDWISTCWFPGTGHPKHEWAITGEWPKVTLAPSIGIQKLPDGSYHWHGYLEDGIFVER